MKQSKVILNHKNFYTRSMYPVNPYIFESEVTDFQSFVAPESFKQPTQFSEFGLSLNIYQIYKDYSNANKKLIYEFTSAIETLTLPVISNVTYRWGETIAGVDYVTDVASGTAFTAGSIKRYVIINSTAATLIADGATYNSLFKGSLCIYFGKNITQFSLGGSTYCKYIFLEDSTSLTVIVTQSCDNCQQLTGTLTIPNTLTNKTLGNYAFRYCNGINKVTIPESITNLGSTTFLGSAAIIGRHYYIYCMVAPIASNSFGPRPAILHIKSGASGYDVAPWNDPAYFSQIIQDL